jgi:glyoxylase-like metal-dependent hydrolase (beta-lactamase superfamily II)
MDGKPYCRARAETTPAPFDRCPRWLPQAGPLAIKTRENAVKSPLTLSRPGSLDIRPASGECATSIRDFVFLSQGASNAYLVTTPGGDVLINTGLGIEAPIHQRCFGAVSRNAIRTIVLTQGHVDHVGGVDLFRAAHPGVVVIAQRDIGACQQDDARIKGFRQRRNLRFFPEFLSPLRPGGAPAEDGGLGRAQSVARPDVTFATEHRFELGGVRFELFAVPGGETIDSALVWLPDHRILFSGNALGPLFPHMPNLYTIRGDRLRFAVPYLEAVQKILDLEPDLLVTGHFDPIEGAALIRSELVRLRDAVRFVHDATVDGMNAGEDVFALMKEVRLPPELEVGEDYGTVPWTVRAIYEGYAGWFRFRSTTELYAVPAEDVYADLAELAGCDALVKRAAEHLREGRPLQAIHLTEIALAKDARHRAAWGTYVEAHERLLAESHARNRWQKYWLEGEIARGRRALAEP